MKKNTNSILIDLQKYPMLVAALDGDDLPSLLEEAKTLRADMVELRMDIWGHFFRDDMLQKLARFKEKIGVPMLFSFRGGNPFPAWWQPLHWRALAAVGLIDVEWNPKYPWKEIRQQTQALNVGLMISHHDYDKTPPLKTLQALAKIMLKQGAQIIKFAAKVKTPADIRTLLDVNRSLAPKTLGTVMGMGPWASVSRLAAPLYGSCLVYGFMGSATAIGQSPYKELQARMRSLNPQYEEGFQARQETRSPVKSLSLHTKQFQKSLKALKVDGFWLTHIPDLFYLAGYGSEACWGLIGARTAAMMVPGLAVDQAKALAPGYTILQLKKSAEAFKSLVDYAVEAGWKRVGYDPYKVPDAYMTALKKSSQGQKVEWVPIKAPAEKLRIKKDAVEIKAMREAGHITALGFKHVMKITRPGMRESDVAAEFEYFIKKRGASKTAYDSIVASGPNAAYPHHHTGERVLRKNDVVLCDMAAMVDGYCSDLTRTWFLGSISDDAHTIYNAVDRAQKLSLAAVKPGAHAAQIDRISRDEIERTGYGRRFIHSTGHGVGAEIHEAPWVSMGSTDILEPGMVLTVEPGIYVEGWGGVRIEDTVLVTKTGYDVFTK